MRRSAVSLPPIWEAPALAAIVNGIIAVSAPEARAIDRSNPATFWNRLTTRRTNSGRSQNVSVRTARSRLASRRPSGSGSERALVLAIDEDAVHDVDAQEEDGERPPRVVAADRQQRDNGTQAARGDPDEPAPRVAAHERYPRGELDEAHDDEDPPHRVEVREDEAPVADEDVRVVKRSDAVDDVQGADDQQQDRGESGSARTSHGHFLLGVRPTVSPPPAESHHPGGMKSLWLQRMRTMKIPQTMMLTSQLLAFIQSRTFGMAVTARRWKIR